MITSEAIFLSWKIWRNNWIVDAHYENSHDVVLKLQSFSRRLGINCRRGDNDEQSYIQTSCWRIQNYDLKTFSWIRLLSQQGPRCQEEKINQIGMCPEGVLNAARLAIGVSIVHQCGRETTNRITDEPVRIVNRTTQMTDQWDTIMMIRVTR